MTHPCPVCPHHCAPREGETGLCRARVARGGRMVLESYGRITALALDPIEKKPLAHFHPGSLIVSVGSYGCNLRCSFCQNHDISQNGAGRWQLLSPKDLCREAVRLVPQGNIGLAFTYNEPAVGWEYVEDAATLAREEGLLNVMVTNGYFCADVRRRLLDVMDAFNIDLKCFSQAGYRQLGGDLDTVKGTIAAVAAQAHVEVTTLVVPDLSDSEADMEAEAAFLAGIDPDIPLHITRYFPRWQADAPPTPLETLERLACIAGRHLRRVHLGNC